jgi:anti-sigma factor (TIGR02949 family)
VAQEPVTPERAAMTDVNRKTCEEAFRLLDDFLDRRLGPEETRLVEEHLRVCEACTREFAFETSLLNGVRERLRHLAAPSDLVARILARLPPSDEAREG